MTTVALLAVGYATLVTVILAFFAAAKRGDEAMQRRLEGEPGSPVQVLPTHVPLAGVAVAVRDQLGAERVTVVVSDPGEPQTGLVCACLGAPGQLGRRVPVETSPATMVLDPVEAAALGLPADPAELPWTLAHLPLSGPSGLLGAVTVAGRRPRAYTEGEVGSIERLARHGARHFDRRRHRRTPRTTA
jgi:hypothetical protein